MSIDSAIAAGCVVLLSVGLILAILRWSEVRPPSGREIRRRWESGEVAQMMRDARPYSQMRGEHEVGPPAAPVDLDNPDPPAPPPPTPDDLDSIHRALSMLSGTPGNEDLLRVWNGPLVVERDGEAPPPSVRTVYAGGCPECGGPAPWHAWFNATETGCTHPEVTE